MPDVHTIVGFDVRPVVVPLRPALKTSNGVMMTAPLVLLDIETSQGVIGHAYVFTHTSLVLRSVAQLLRDSLPLLGDQPLAPDANLTMLRLRFAAIGTPGLVEMALSAIEVALRDAQAKVDGQPLPSLAAGSVDATKATDAASSPVARFLAHAAMADAVLGEPLGSADRFAAAGGRPGVGIVWNQEAIRQFSV